MLRALVILICACYSLMEEGRSSAIFQKWTSDDSTGMWYVSDCCLGITEGILGSKCLNWLDLSPHFASFPLQVHKIDNATIATRPTLGLRDHDKWIRRGHISLGKSQGRYVLLLAMFALTVKCFHGLVANEHLEPSSSPWNVVLIPNLMSQVDQAPSN